MEPYWARFTAFVKNSLTSKFKAFMPGVCMGFIGSQHILWVGVSLSMVETVVKGCGTIIMAFGSGLATSYAGYLIDRYKEKKSPTSTINRKRKRA